MNRAQDAYSRVSQSLPMLRGWAILWIVAYHLMGNTRGYLDLSGAIATFSKGGLKNIVDPALELFIAAGSTGVNVFLIISGFGLTASWWKKYGSQGIEEIPLLLFLRRRVLRIVPLFWAAVAIALLLYVLNSAYAPFGQDIWQEGALAPLFAIFTTLTTLRNFIPDHYYFLNGAWWYVGLSIQLYLIFPFLIRIGCRYGWLKLLVLSFLFSLFYRAAFLFSPIGGSEDLIPLAFFPSRLFEFTFGIYLAMLCLQPSGKFQANESVSGSLISGSLINLLLKPRLIPVSLGLFLIGLSFKWSTYAALVAPSDALIGVGLFCGLVAISQAKPFRLNWLGCDRLSRFIGKYSYGIYLTHMNSYLVLWPVAAAWVPSYWIRFAIVTIACCIAGFLFETGFSACQRTLNSDRKTAVQPSPSPRSE